MDRTVTLLPETPLPPPPKTLELAESLPAVGELRAHAFAQRPDLQAWANRIEAERAALGLAHKEYYPISRSWPHMTPSGSDPSMISGPCQVFA